MINIYHIYYNTQKTQSLNSIALNISLLEGFKEHYVTPDKVQN